MGERTLEDIGAELKLELGSVEVQEQDVNIFEELCYTARETGVLDMRLYGPEAETIMRLAMLSFALDKVPDNLRV